MNKFNAVKKTSGKRISCVVHFFSVKNLYLITLRNVLVVIILKYHTFLVSENLGNLIFSLPHIFV